MPRVSKAAFYAVHRGHKPGIYMSWPDCEQQIKGFPKAQHKKFSTEAEAKAFVDFGFAAGGVAAAATPNSTTRAKGNSLSPAKGLVDKTTYMSKKLRKETVKPRDIQDESGWDVVYTDGACRGNGQKIGATAGIGVWWGPNDPRNIAERCPGDQTNNRAELIAIIRVLETAPKSSRPLLIKTDSSYSIFCVRDWISSWRKRGWKTADGKVVKNKPIVVYLAALLDERSAWGQRVQLQHVRGHAGIPGNEGADSLAGFGASMPAQPERDWSLKQNDFYQEDIGDFAHLGPSMSAKPVLDLYEGENIPYKEGNSRSARLGNPTFFQAGQSRSPEKVDVKDMSRDLTTKFEFDANDLLSDEEMARMKTEGFY